MNTKIIYITLLLSIALFACNNSDSTVNREKEETMVKLDVDYLTEGTLIAETTFKVLSENLQNAMADGGVENALKFCNVNAMPLTDSLSKHFNVQIKRTSHKVRNPNNAPSEQEQKVLDKYLAKGAVLKPIVKENENQSVSFYAPIVTKGLCVTCHGQVGTAITAKNYQMIQSLYREDKAVGFNVDELRGIWSITFKNK